MQQTTRRTGQERALTLFQYISTVCVWVYIIYRAFTFGIVHDEAISYSFVKTNYLKALPGTFNTHWINTIFMKLVLLFPGEDRVWKLRLLSVFCWPVFAIMIIKLGRRFNNPMMGGLFFSICIFNPYLVLYFSLARGYALSCLLIVVCLWYAGKLTDLQEITPQKWIPVFLYAAVAVVSNFSALYFFIALSLVYSAYLFSTGKQRLLLSRSGFKLLALIVSTCTFAASSLLFIKFYSHEAEDIGGAGLISGLFASQLKRFGLQFLPGNFYFIAGFCWFVLLVLSAGWSCYYVYRHKKISLLFIVSCTCVMIMLLNGCFHFLIQTVYLGDRRALFSFSPLVFAAAGLLDQPGLIGGYKKVIVNSITVLLISVILFNAYLNVNLQYFTEWPLQSAHEEVLH